MKTSLKWIAVSCLLLMLAGGCSSPASAPAPAVESKATLLVGAAAATINPEDGVFLAGYEHGRASTGVHDGLYAKAVVFDDGKTAVALVVLDAVSLQYPTVQHIREAASKTVQGLDLPPERIIVQATHTHCAPDTIGIYGPDATTNGVNPAYMEHLVQTAAAQVARAAAGRRPAALRHAETVCAGWAVNDSESEALDNSVVILQCLDETGNNIATLTNFACHPTVLDGRTTLVSADWVGAFYKAMGEALPGEHLFLQGAIGAWIQPKTPERSFALAEQYGNDLAEKTLAALAHTTPITEYAIRATHKPFTMPLENDGFRLLREAGLLIRDMNDTGIPTEVSWFAVGPAQFATHPGETAPLFASQTRELMKTGPKFVLGLGLDHLGYICPPSFFKNPQGIPFAEYQISMSPGEAAGPSMMAALREIIP